MAVQEKYYLGTGGSNMLTAPELSYVTILHVEREGLGHRVIDTIPTTGQRAVQYVPSQGRLIFDPANPFTLGLPDEDEPSDVYSREKIYVLWKD